MLKAKDILQPRDIKAGEMTYGERLELVRALSDDKATGYERISRVIGTLHGFTPDPGQAAKLASYVEEVSEAVKGWLRREAEECHVPPTADERAAGVDLLAKETGDMGTAVALAKSHCCRIADILALPYTEVFTELKINAAGERYHRRLAAYYEKKRKSASRRIK